MNKKNPKTRSLSSHHYLDLLHSKLLILIPARQIIQERAEERKTYIKEDFGEGFSLSHA